MDSRFHILGSRDKNKPYRHFASLVESIFAPCKLSPEDIQIDNESQEYEAMKFSLQGKTFLFRSGKTTPTKLGHFVTIWKRINGITIPHDSEDSISAFVIGCRNEKKVGFFFFPKSILVEKRIISHLGAKGKLGIRVYPPWVLTESNQAKKTQSWQVNYFHDISSQDFNPARFLKHLDKNFGLRDKTHVEKRR